MTNVYNQLPYFPRFSSINIPHLSNDLYFEGVKNPSINLDNLDYEILQGINVVRQRYTLRRTGFVNINNQLVPEEIYGDFWVYKTAPFPSPIFLHGWEGWENPNNAYASIGADNISNWDVFQHYKSLNLYQAQFPVHVSYFPVPANFGTTNGWISVQQLAGYSQTEYNRWAAGEWDWGSWKYADINTYEFPPSQQIPGLSYSYQGIYELRTFPTVIKTKPNYIDLLRGYRFDSRTIVNNPAVIPSTSEKVRISYYRENRLEPVPSLSTIDWMSYEIDTIAGTSLNLPIEDCTLGTLNISSVSLKTQLVNTVFPSTNYASKYYFFEYLDELFLSWNQTTVLPARTNRLRILGANNNVWNNRANPTNDLDIDLNHPMFAVDDNRAYNWHIAPQINSNGIGSLIMDSPRAIETRMMVEWLTTALNALQYQIEAPAIIGNGTAENPQTPALHKLDWHIRNSRFPATLEAKIIAIWKSLGGDYLNTNRITSSVDRVTNAAWYLENIARVLGLRRDDNGKIDRIAERDKYRPETLVSPSLGEPSSDGSYNGYSLACFGDRGRMMPHLPTTYKSGKSQDLYDVYHDIPQQLELLLRQVDKSLSIQHGSEIRVNGLDGKIHSYPNQLAVQLECLQRLEKINYNTQKSYLQNTVIGTELRGLYSGIGIPITTNFLQLKEIGNKQVLSVPYFTHQKNKPSTAQLLTTVHVNLAVINGVLMPKKQPNRDIYNPFKRFTSNKSNS